VEEGPQAELFALFACYLHGDDDVLDPANWKNFIIMSPMAIATNQSE
jgi:hypothetical protein